MEGYDQIQEIRLGIGYGVYQARQVHSRAPVLIIHYTADSAAIAEMVSKVRRCQGLEPPELHHFPRILRHWVVGRPEADDLILACETVSGVPLQQYIQVNSSDLEAVLHVAIQLAEAVNTLHARGLRLAQINSESILWNPEIRLLQFRDLTTVINYEQWQDLADGGEFHSRLLLEFFPYSAPEQTGRMRNQADHRSDFYTLGILYYELLTGATPFPFGELGEIMHAHLARRPTPPAELDQGLSPVLSDIVMRLLAKNPAERYQSAQGLKRDLERCAEHWKKEGRIRPFKLGRFDAPEKFIFPTRVYGREKELAVLKENYESARQGNQVFILVNGYAGIGKSRLVTAFLKSLHLGGGFSISGKYEQYQINRPYAAIVRAFQEMILWILKQSSQEIAVWQDIFQKALQGNAAIIAEMIPEIVWLIGPQPSPPDLPPDTARNRFHQVFLNFIKAAARKDKPLVLFLDDLQWADPAGLKLIRHLAGEDIPYLFLLGAYRTNEVDETHPLTALSAAVRDLPISFHVLSLGALLPDSIGLFTADLFQHAQNEALEALAGLLAAKTGGNPFFLQQFITAVAAAGHLTYDYSRGDWCWDLEKIAARPVTDNVIELVLERIQDLPQGTRALLEVAACIGTCFHPDFLARVVHQQPAEVEKKLQAADRLGLIRLTAEQASMAPESLPKQPQSGSRESGRYEFMHDRILQAVYGSIPIPHRQGLHLSIGRSLLHLDKAAQEEVSVFDAANHLNQAKDLLESPEERILLTRLNLQAGKKAKTTTAFLQALQYFNTGIDLLPKNSWTDEYSLTLNLHVEAMEAAFLNGDYQTMQVIAAQVRRYGRRLLDQMRISQLEILACMAENKPHAAVQSALSTLEFLGVRLPTRPGKLRTLMRLVQIKWRMAGKTAEKIQNLPRMTDRHKLAAMRILIHLSSVSFISVPALYPLVVFQQVDFSLRYGNAPESAFAYTIYGLILCALPGALADIDKGYRFGRLGLRLLDEFNAEDHRSNTIFIFNCFIRHWQEHLRTTLEPALSGYEIGLRTGNLESAAFCLFIHDYHTYCVGKELNALEKQLRRNHLAIQKIRQQTTLSWHAITWQIVLNLLGTADDPCALNGPAYIEDEMLPRHIQTKDRTVLGNLFFSKAYLHYLFHRYAQAKIHMEAVPAYQDALAATVGVVLISFYDSLILLSLFSQASSHEKRQIRKRVQSNQKRLKKWARYSPANNLHKFYLVEAEYLRVTGQQTEAMQCYDKAIALSGENGFVQEEALANERTAIFFLGLHNPRVAKSYLKEAQRGYESWGARAKVDHLKEQYGDLLQSEPEKKGTVFADRIDFPAVLQASQTISKEIIMAELVKKFLAILMETAGASRILFLTVEQDQLHLKAAAEVDQDIAFLNSPRSIHDQETILLPEVVNYVRRTSRPMLIDDASEEAGAATAYLRKYAPRSILCLPVIRQTELTAILYLENNITANAFTPKRIEILQVLSAQAAISMENARLYDNLARLESQLSYRLKIEQVIAAISASFIKLAPTEFHTGIDQALALLGQFVNEDRCYVFQISKDGKTISETNLWHAPHITPRTAQLQQIPMNSFPWLQSRLECFEIIHIPSLEALPATLGAFRNFLESIDVRSFVWVPMAHGNRLIGFMGFDAVHQAKTWDQDYIRLLRTLSEILANACAAKRSAEELGIYQDQLRSLSSELILAEEKERRRIAVGLHDGIGHALANTVNKLGTLREIAAAGGLLDTWQEIQSLIDQSIQNTRSLTFEISPHILYDIGLEAAVDWLAEKTEKEHGISIEFEDDLQPKPLDDTTRILIYQAIRELIFNVVKHARAKHAKVAIGRRNEFLDIVIADDGMGFDQTQGHPDSGQNHGFGLFSIRERVRAMGGTIEIHSKPGQGTRVALSLPLKPDEKRL